MFCHKCGTQIDDGAVFCPKCGTKVASVNADQQPTDIPMPDAKGQQTSGEKENTKQTSSNDTAKTNGGLRKAANIGRVLMCGSLALLFLMSFLPLRINPVILVAGVAIGIILSAFGAKRPLGISKIIELVVGVILLVAVAIYFMSSGGESNKYKDSSTSTESDTRSDSKSTESGSQSGSSSIGKTQSFDDDAFGNMEVTLDYVQFVDGYQDIGGYQYADEGFVYLWAAFTEKNIGTVNGSLPPMWTTLIYDDKYEFKLTDIVSDFDLIELPPLSAPIEEAFVYKVPTTVMESDKSFVLNIGNGFGKNLLSFTFSSSDILLEKSSNEVSDQAEERNFSYDTTAGFSESLEYYSRLSGSYVGSGEQTTLSISIYSSLEEGEAAIGTVGMYVGDEWYYIGEIVAEPEWGVYQVATDTGEEVVLAEYSYDNTIVLELSVNGEVIDEYWMVEHYEP